MSDLAAFLAARLNEDEEYLRIVIGSIPYQEAVADHAEISAGLLAAVVSLMSRPDVQALSARWANSGVRPPNDLGRALREVAAKRAILERYTAAPDWTGGEDVRYLATVYSDHPDYDPAWAVASQ